MTTVADLIAHLQTLPQDLIVQCLTEQSYGHETWTKYENLKIDHHIYEIGRFLEIGDK